MSERNFEVQLGADWSIPFGSEEDLLTATMEFLVSQGAVRGMLLSTDTPASENSPYNSPFNSPFTSPPSSPQSFAPFSMDSPAVSGTVTVQPDDQIYIEPGAWNYEIRAQFATGIYTTLQYGKLIVQASLFAWPVS